MADTSAIFVEAILIKRGKGGYRVLSSKGKNLGGPYKTLEEAKIRLRRVESFKHSGQRPL